MTLKELLSNVDFDEVAPFIVKHYPEMEKCMAGMKMAFDGMRNTVPTKVGEEQITVEFYGEEGEDKWLDAFHVDDDVWENVVGREVVIADNVHAPLEEIVAIILYQATYFGFTPADRDETFESWHTNSTPPTNGNPYRIQWWHLTQREHDSLCQKKDIGTRYYSLDPKRPFQCLSDKPMNRIKRKRAHRWEKRIDELDRLANRWDLLQKIKRCNLPPDFPIFEAMLFKAKDCEVSRRLDYSAKGEGLSYIYELMVKYDQCDYSKADKTLLWVQSPRDINAEALQQISTLVSNPQALVPSPLIISQINVQGIERTKLTIVQLFFS